VASTADAENEPLMVSHIYVYAYIYIHMHIYTCTIGLYIIIPYVIYAFYFHRIVKSAFARQPSDDSSPRIAVMLVVVIVVVVVVQLQLLLVMEVLN
jgi:hypothetical protein